MAKTIHVDGVEVQIKPKRRLIDTTDAPVMGRKRGLTGRQHLEHSLKTIGEKAIEYVTGDGNDFERALRMAGVEVDSETDIVDGDD